MENKSNLVAYTAVFAVVAIAAAAAFFLFESSTETTKDAYVGGNQIMVNPQITGTITKVETDDTYFVEKGQLLASLDTTDQMISLNLRKEELANACRQVVNLFELVKQRKAELQEKEVVLLNSSREWQRHKQLFAEKTISQETYQNVETQFAIDSALLNLVKYQLEAAQASVENTTVFTHPQVQEAAEALKKAVVELKRCQVASPIDGIVAQRRAQVGGWVAPESSLMTVIPVEQMWVDANFREVQLKRMRIGQSVELTSDIYGSSVKYHGKIVGIGMGTGSVFSALPAQNATGNWIKIVQRVPVRISLDPKELKRYPLRLGLSMIAEVDVSNSEGELIPKPSPQAVLYQTDVFGNQEEGADKIIAEIFYQNVPAYYRDAKWK